MKNITTIFQENDHPYHWYVVHTDNQQYLKRVLTGRDGIEEIYLPMEHVNKNNSSELKARVLLTTYIFVYAIKSCIRGELEEFDAQLEFDSHRDTKQTMIIKDDEMDTFKTMCEHHLDIEMLRNPYVTFFNNDRAHIMVDPFVGFEGFIKEIEDNCVTTVNNKRIESDNSKRPKARFLSHKYF